MAYCGYLDRHGVFYDCSQQEGPYKHNSWCEERGYDEDQLLVKEGWVKFSDALFNKYIFCYYDGLSVPQIRWLQNHGYKIEDYDLAEKSLRWVVNQIPDFKPSSGEPNGCNRKEGICRAHDYCFDLRDERDALKAENAAFRKALARTIDSSDDVCGYCAYYIPPKPDENCIPCGHLGECVDGVLQHFMQKAKIKEETK